MAIRLSEAMTTPTTRAHSASVRSARPVATEITPRISRDLGSV